MKQKISWHENNLQAQKKYLQGLEDESKRLQITILNCRHNIFSLEIQISQAKKKKMESFDAERLCHGTKKLLAIKVEPKELA